jgi:5-methylcytosine-specific restriction endonuclease McrA
MARQNNPKTHANGTWTTPRFFSFIRSALRRAFTRWPANYAARNDARRPYYGPNAKQKWEYKCAICNDWFAAKETQLDHRIPCGSLRDFADLPGFTERLFCEKDGLRVLCKQCHKQVTKEQRGL